MKKEVVARYKIYRADGETAKNSLQWARRDISTLSIFRSILKQVQKGVLK